MRSRQLSFHAYRAALLEYVRGSGESALSAAYELGRIGLQRGDGFLDILHVHEQAVGSILDDTSADEVRARLNASSQFLIEALSPFEMIVRGYLALVTKPADKPKRRSIAPLQ